MPGWTSIAAALALAASAPAAIDVPYLPQSGVLCGGAAVAMVFRYWGDVHASIQQFAPLVDARAGGITTDALVAAVQTRGWRATPMVGSIDLLREQLEARRPVIALIEDRRLRYHYVVVTGVDASAVLVHDPAVGPSRRIPLDDWRRVWAPTHFWGLVILPGDEPAASRTTPPVAPSSPPSTECDRLLSSAIAEVQRNGLASADATFAAVSARCPSSAGPARELAGIRFAEQNWAAASALARRALALDPGDTYAWDVLGSSRFMSGDTSGALDAWNREDKPRIEAVKIEGAARTRYQLLAEALGLTPNTLLTSDAFTRAAHRAADLPDRTSSGASLSPGDDGYATVDVAIAERSPYPRSPIAWAGMAARFGIDREAAVQVPGGMGQGEVWEAGWRWWNNRPRVAFAFAAPRVGWLPGVWRVEGSWERQTYASAGGSSSTAQVRETRSHAGIAVSEWLTGRVKYAVSAGADVWSDPARSERRTASIGGTLERRFARDRIALIGAVAAWLPLGSGSRFETAGLRAVAASAFGGDWSFIGTAGIDTATDAAPLALWPGAGDGHARPALLRAHPLLDDGIVSGPAFGRTLAYLSAEEQRWIGRETIVRFGGAAFVDMARATRGLAGADSRTQTDVGVGLRVRIPGSGTIRVDAATGLRDGAHAVSAGWQVVF